jgi:hypothetical protein
MTTNIGTPIRSSHFCGVTASVLTSSALDNRFKPWSGQAKDYTTICCFSAKNNEVLRGNSKYWLVMINKQDSVSEWGEMPIHGLLCQSDCTMKIQAYFDLLMLSDAT